MSKVPVARRVGWFCVAGLFASALAQTGNQEQPIVRMTVNLVQIDAVVTDSEGHQAANLTPNDFEILEDGKPQKITAFSYVKAGDVSPLHVGTKPHLGMSGPDAAAPPPSVLTPLKPQQIRRTVVLMVDDLGLSFESVARVRRVLKKFVDEQMRDGDLVAIIRTSAGMGSLQQFTANKRLLYAAIDRVQWYPSAGMTASAFEPVGSNPMSNAAQMRMGGRGDGQQRRFDQGRRASFSFGTLGAINFVLRALRGLPGRKALILFSDGVPREYVAGGLSSIVDLANRSAVVVYTVDARALPVLGLTAADSTLDPKYRNPRTLANVPVERADQYLGSQEGLAYLARQTGGFFVHDTNDLNWGIHRVLEDLSGYYLIGYKPADSSFEPEDGQRRFHKLQVKVTVAGLHVRSRTGYLGVPDDESRPVYQTRQEQLNAALNSPFSSGDIPVQLTCLFSEVPNNGAAVRTLVHVDAHDLTFAEEPNGARKLVLDVVAWAFDEQGHVVGSSDRTYTMELPVHQYEDALNRGFVYKLNVAIAKPGAYQMRVVVRDAASAKVGSASQFVEVPDLRRHALAISGIVLHEALPPDREVTASEDQYEIADPGTPAVRVFRPGQTVGLGFVIFNARMDRTTGRPEIETRFALYRNQQCVYSSPAVPFQTNQREDLGRLMASGSLRLGSDLSPGDYALQVVAGDKLAPKKVGVTSQWTDFKLVQ